MSPLRRTPAPDHRHGLGGSDLIAAVVVMAILLVLTKAIAVFTDVVFRILGL